MFSKDEDILILILEIITLFNSFVALIVYVLFSCCATTVPLISPVNGFKDKPIPGTQREP
jgi:hypothetical protein